MYTLSYIDTHDVCKAQHLKVREIFECIESIEITRCPWASWMYRNYRDYKLNF